MQQWCRQWYGRARLLVTEADELLGADRWTEACARYLEAVDLCALGLRDSSPGPDVRAVDELAVAAFQAAAPLLPHPVLGMRTVVHGAEISGYRADPPPSDGRAAASISGVVYVTDARETPETCYRPVVLPVIRLGLACLVVTVRPGTTCDAATGDAVERWLRHHSGFTDAVLRFNSLRTTPSEQDSR